MDTPQIIPERTAKTPGNKRKWKIFLLAIAAAALLFGGYLFITLQVYPTVLPQQAVHLLKDATLPQPGQKVLIFSPHPDDETIAAGGYIAEARQLGADVRIVLVTDGNKHHNEAVRYEEFKKATTILGVQESNLVFLGLPDGRLQEQDQTVLSLRLKEQIDLYNPDIIIYPYRQDFHPDHAVTGKIVSQLLAASSSKVIAFQYLVHYEFFFPHPRQFKPDLFLLPPARLVRFGNNWQKVMFPQSIENLKQQAIYSYKSQLSISLLKDLLLASIRQNELLILQ